MDLFELDLVSDGGQLSDDALHQQKLDEVYEWGLWHPQGLPPELRFDALRFLSEEEIDDALAQGRLIATYQ